MSNNEDLDRDLADVTVELSRVDSLDEPPASVDQLEQNLPELDYYEAELKSLRSALEAEHP